MRMGRRNLGNLGWGVGAREWRNRLRSIGRLAVVEENRACLGWILRVSHRTLHRCAVVSGCSVSFEYSGSSQSLSPQAPDPPSY